MTAMRISPMPWASALLSVDRFQLIVFTVPEFHFRHQLGYAPCCADAAPVSGELLLFGLAANSIARTGSIVEDKISLAFVDYHRDVRAVDGWAPLVRHSAVRTYRIGSREFGWLHVVSRDSYEKLSGEIALAVEGEPANGSEVPDTNYRSSGMQTIAAMQGGVRAICPVLCVHRQGKARHNQC